MLRELIRLYTPAYVCVCEFKYACINVPTVYKQVAYWMGLSGECGGQRGNNVIRCPVTELLSLAWLIRLIQLSIFNI